MSVLNILVTREVTNYIIPHGSTKIKDYYFCNIITLKSVSIPKSVKKLENIVLVVVEI